jgi:hypothetical protein
MCHYVQLTFPVPAVIVATVSEPTVAVEPVRPAPIVIVPALVRYLRITIPEPPLPPLPKIGAAFLKPPPPPPPPVFAVPA